MKRVELIHRGHVTAAGFIIDVPAIGQREARRRTLEMLDPADRLLLILRQIPAANRTEESHDLRQPRHQSRNILP